MLHHLLLSEGMLAFGQTREVLIAHNTGQTPFFRKPSLPFAMPLLIAAPVVLSLRSKLPLMVRTYLPRRQRLGERQHKNSISRSSFDALGFIPTEPLSLHGGLIL